MAYRLEYYVSIFNALLYIVIFTSVWQAIFKDNEVRFGMTRELMVNYAVFVTLIKSTMVKTRDMIGQRVRTGEISVDLMKPVSLPLLTLADATGSLMFQIFSRAIPLIIFCSLMFDLMLPPGLDLTFAFHYLFGFLIFHSLLFIFGVAAFFITENFPLWLLNSASVSLLSGSILPLDILPEIVRKIALWTPYPYIFYLPAMKLLKDQTPVEYPLATQLIVLIVTYGIGLTLYHLGKRRLHIQGG